MPNKKKLPIAVFEIVWYTICALVIIWGIVYCCLGLGAKYLSIDSLKEFSANFKTLFKLNVFYWGLIIIAIGALAGSVVLIIYAKTFDRANDREQRRSARLAALKKDEDKVVAEQTPEAVESAPTQE